MRSHNHILRKLSEQNLDTKIAYVVSDNGNLIPKNSTSLSSKDEVKNEKEDLKEENFENISKEYASEEMRRINILAPTKKLSTKNNKSTIVEDVISKPDSVE